MEYFHLYIYENEKNVVIVQYHLIYGFGMKLLSVL